jgi:mono/diheme cytochrome c family protein
MAVAGVAAFVAVAAWVERADEPLAAPSTPASVALGRQVFAAAGCAGCHTLADAGATGTVGPDLDAAEPSAALVTDRVTNGLGVMPSFAGKLSTAQIAAVAAYVSSTAGK